MKIHTYFNGVDVEGPVDEMLAKMERENKRAVLCPHILEDGVRVYRIRALMHPLPEKIDEFVGAAPDPSKVVGLVNYHGFVAENVLTRGPDPFLPLSPSTPRVEAWRAWLMYLQAGEQVADARRLAEKTKNEVTGVLRAAMLLVSSGGVFPYLAEASTVASLPEVHFELALQACGMGGASPYWRPEEVLRQVRIGTDLRADGLHILPWRWEDRVLLPAKLGAQAALQLKMFEEGEDWAKRGLHRFPDDRDLQLLLKEAQRGSDRSPKRPIRLRGLPAHMTTAIGTEGDNPLFALRVVGTNTDDGPGLGEFAVLDDPTPPEITDYDAVERLYLCKGIVPLSFYQWKELKRRYPFLPNITPHMPMGFDPIEPIQKDVDVAFVHNEVTEEIVRRVYACFSDRGIIHCLSTPTLDQIARSRVFLDAPLVDPVTNTTILQAQSAECVPVVAGVGCLPELVKGGYFYQPPATSEDFIQAAADRISYLLSHEDERKQVALDGAVRVREEFSWAVLAPKWKRFLRAGGGDSIIGARDSV